MSIITKLKGRIGRNWKAQHLAEQWGLAKGRTVSAAMFEALEPRTHLDATSATGYEHADAFVGAPDAYTFSLHHGPQSLTSSPGSIDWRAEGESLVGSYLRAQDVDSSMRPRRPNLIPTMGATPTAGAAERPRDRKPDVPPRETATRVLVIEDDALARRAMATILRGSGFQVAVAATVAEGVRQLAARPHHVILDLTLPDGDGEQVLRHIRSVGMKTRVTITSGSGDADRLENVRSMGADDVLNKPVDMRSLTNLLSAAR